MVMKIADQRLEKLMRRKRLDAILFWGFENIRYLCGFTGSDGALICAREGRVFLTDSRYTEQAKSEVVNAIVSPYRQKISGVGQALKSLRGRRIGFEAAAVNFESYRRLQEELSRVSFIPLSEEFAGLRAVKEAEEIASLRKAVRIASESFRKTILRVRPGSTEANIAEALECQFRRGGRKAFVRHHRGFGFPGSFAPRRRLGKEIGKRGDRGHRFRDPVSGVSLRRNQNPDSGQAGGEDEADL